MPIDRSLASEHMRRLVEHLHGRPASELDVGGALLSPPAVKKYDRAIWTAETRHMDKSGVRLALSEQVL